MGGGGGLKLNYSVGLEGLMLIPYTLSGVTSYNEI